MDLGVVCKDGNRFHLPSLSFRSLEFWGEWILWCPIMCVMWVGSGRSPQWCLWWPWWAAGLRSVLQGKLTCIGGGLGKHLHCIHWQGCSSYLEGQWFDVAFLALKVYITIVVVNHISIWLKVGNKWLNFYYRCFMSIFQVSTSSIGFGFKSVTQTIRYVEFTRLHSGIPQISTECWVF